MLGEMYRNNNQNNHDKNNNDNNNHDNNDSDNNNNDSNNHDNNDSDRSKDADTTRSTSPTGIRVQGPIQNCDIYYGL